MMRLLGLLAALTLAVCAVCTWNRMGEEPKPNPASSLYPHRSQVLPPRRLPSRGPVIPPSVVWQELAKAWEPAAISETIYRGVVVDGLDGRPISGAMICQGIKDLGEHCARSTEQGTFVLSLPIERSRLGAYPRVEKNGYGGTFISRKKLQKALQPDGVRLELWHDAIVEVRVRTSTGHPASGAKVGVEPCTSCEIDSVGPDMMSREGVYSFTIPMISRESTINVFALRSDREVALEQVDVTAGERVTLDLRLQERPGALLTGKLVDTFGRPIPGASLSVDSADEDLSDADALLTHFIFTAASERKTAADGSFRLDVPASGFYRVSFADPDGGDDDWAVARVEATAEGTGQIISLSEHDE